MEAAMVAMMKPPEAGELDALALKFRSLELESEADLQTVLRLVKMREAVSPGENIVDTRSPVRQLTVLLAGVACLHKRLEDDSRQIYTFQYPGDFCDLHRYMLPELDRFWKRCICWSVLPRPRCTSIDSCLLHLCM